MAPTDTHDEVRMPFGKHKGVPLSDIPSDYILWGLETRTWRPDQLDLKKQMQLELAARLGIYVDRPVPQRPKLAWRGIYWEIIDAGLKAVTKRYHPDVDGHPRALENM